MAKKTVEFNKKGIGSLPDNKPVVYKIKSKNGANHYTGIAKRGRVKARVAEHLPGNKDHVPGTKVEIEQMSTIKDAREKESRIIARSKPKHNKQGK